MAIGSLENSMLARIDFKIKKVEMLGRILGSVVVKLRKCSM